MMNFIAKLQEKPLHVRRRILVLSTLFITILIVAIWFPFSYLSSFYFNNSDASSTNMQASAVSSFGGIFTTVKNIVVSEKQVLQNNLKF